MKYHESIDIYREANQSVRELSSLLYKKHTHAQVVEAVRKYTDLEQALDNARQFKMVNKVRNYACNLLDLEQNNSHRSKKHTITKEDAILIFSNINAYPFNIGSLLDHDSEFNQLLVSSAIKTGVHDDGDHRDAKAWAFVANKLARLGDEDTWMMIIEEMDKAVYSAMLSPCLTTIDSLTTISKKNSALIKDVIEKQIKIMNENRSLAIEPSAIPFILDGSFKLLGKDVTQSIVNDIDLLKIKKKNYAYKLLNEYGIALREESLKSSFESILSKNPTDMAESGAMAIAAITLSEHTEWAISLMDESVENINNLNRASYSINTIKEILKHLNKNNNTEVYGAIINYPKSLIESVTSVLIKAYTLHKVTGMRQSLEKYCGLTLDQYFELDAYRPYRRERLEKDMAL